MKEAIKLVWQEQLKQIWTNNACHTSLSSFSKISRGNVLSVQRKQNSVDLAPWSRWVWWSDQFFSAFTENNLPFFIFCFVSLLLLLFFFNFKTVKLMTWTSKHHSQTLDWKRKKSDSFIDIPRRNTTGPNAVLKFPWKWVEISKSKPGFFLLTHNFLKQEIKEV